MTSFVYFLRLGDFVKIGVSTNPRARIQHLQTGVPFGDFELLGFHPGTKEHEHHLHKKFAQFHHRREWFRSHESVLDIARNGFLHMDFSPSRSRRKPNKLSEFLSENGISQASFGATIGVTQQALSKWVRGDATPRPKQMVKIIGATGGAVTANDFLPFEPVSMGAPAQ